MKTIEELHEDSAQNLRNLRATQFNAACMRIAVITVAAGIIFMLLA